MAALNVAIVGCGFVANSHFKAWSRIPYAKVVALCDPNKLALERAARNWNIPRVFASVSDMSDSRDIMLWDICTPIKTHADLATEAMENGFDVLIEKPLTLTSKEAEKIVECQNATNKKAGVIHNWLFEPPVLKARAIVEQGVVGEVLGMNITVLHTKDEPMAADKDHWSHQLPGGRFSEMLIHPIYLLRCFLGQVRVESMKASKVGDFQWMKQDELLATFRAGARLAGTYVSFNAPRDSIFIDIYGRQGIVRLDVINATVNLLPRGRLGRLGKATDSLRQALQLSTSTLSNALRVLSKRWYDGHEMCIRLFAKSIMDEEEPPVTLQEGYEVVKVLEDMYRRLESA